MEYHHVYVRDLQSYERREFDLSIEFSAPWRP
ncbi:MAG: hypothetical protein ACJAWS_001957, partial [Oleiphilaceae bacterium]